MPKLLSISCPPDLEVMSFGMNKHRNFHSTHRLIPSPLPTRQARISQSNARIKPEHASLHIQPLTDRA
ncbi:hypothetical protein DSO57_1012308 [Entomophthora muscae]|uniref:Uncharacterized protein n=1 Tax=Entomophthora muscae TaxID=34485 RepID=A0ACC2T5W9_9FUNG|nr:hypothetical protein DSO57_1012308 [Entomophthora muscae]